MWTLPHLLFICFCFLHLVSSTLLRQTLLYSVDEHLTRNNPQNATDNLASELDKIDIQQCHVKDEQNAGHSLPKIYANTLESKPWLDSLLWGRIRVQHHKLQQKQTFFEVGSNVMQRKNEMLSVYI